MVDYSTRSVLRILKVSVMTLELRLDRCVEFIYPVKEMASVSNVTVVTSDTI